MKRVSNPADYIETIDERGRCTYRYAGPMFRLEWSAGRTHTLVRLWLAAICALALFIALGAIPADGLDKRPAVMIPYLVSLWPSMMLAADAYKISRRERPLDRRARDAGAGRLSGDAVFGEVCAAAMCAGQLCSIAWIASRNGGVGTIDFLCLGLAAAYAGAFDAARRCARLVSSREV
ncbi:MAG: hypothetical protein LBH66_02940 [Oscillospiraceae bacterium]|jgi:hypothetical protein|nr:hypothetical protein [Oscillospiraceae bacterium]